MISPRRELYQCAPLSLLQIASLEELGIGGDVLLATGAWQAVRVLFRRLSMSRHRTRHGRPQRAFAALL